MEVCVENLESVITAYKAGAKRIELCSLLALGGLTPSVGFLRVAKRMTAKDFPIFVMIRPRPGEDYQYSELELEIMAEEIQAFKHFGADGFVFGCLTNDQEVDDYACTKLLATAAPFPCTFHRAFDVVKDPEEALKTIIRLGFKRVLTSGQEENALLGCSLIKKLITTINLLKNDIIIMPGGGVNENNLKEILESTSAREFHGSAKSKSPMSKELTVSSDEATVKHMVQIGKSFGLV